MVSKVRRATRDLNAKLKLERSITQKLNRLHKKIVSDFVKSYAKASAVVQASKFEAELTGLLTGHYAKAGSVFGDNLSSALFGDAAITPAEKITLATALSTYYLQRAPDQARHITNTTQKNINTSLEDANDYSRSQAATGAVLSVPEIALTAAAFLAVKLSGRVGSIATTETQAVVEATKETEAEVLAGLAPSIQGGSPRTSKVSKEWFTVGDNLVRPHHVEADRQIQLIGSVFNVGGQQLRWPGDDSLGATPFNTYNCRCASIHDTEEIISVRLQEGFDPFTET